jgi:hypothetical protein
MPQRLVEWCRRELPSLLLAGAASAAFTVFFTWPQALYFRTSVAEHQDSLFSMWRLSWIAHALATAPRHVFDGNVFHPELRTLAFSDATLLEGILGTPFLWLGVPPVMVYNMLFLGGIAASGVGMFVLVRYLTASSGAAIVSTAVFTMAPYRIEHFGHLELQWVMWAPLVFWALHRAVDRTSWRSGLLAGVFLWLQVLSCVYYGVFLALATSALAVALSITAPLRVARALPGLVGGAILGALLTVPYALPYLHNARTLGQRDMAEVAMYSARPASYLMSPAQNWLWGWTSQWGAPELQLFPGLAAVGLALVGLLSRPRLLAWVYGALTLLFIELSLGVNGHLYPWLLARVPFLQGLRSPSRFAIMVCAVLAVGAGFGARALERRFQRPGRVIAIAGVLILMAAEYANRGMALMDPESARRATAYQMIEASGPGVVVELPLPVAESLPGRDPHYQFWSRLHWHPLINGYSGYYPVGYIRTLEQMRRFPDDDSVARLKRLNVRYVVVHREFMKPDEYSELLLRLHAREELRFLGTFSDPIGEASLFVLEP